MLTANIDSLWIGELLASELTLTEINSPFNADLNVRMSTKSSRFGGSNREQMK